MDQFDNMAERLLAHFETAEALRRGFATEKTAEDKRAQVAAIAAFLRDDYWSHPGDFPGTHPVATSRRPEAAHPVVRR